MTLLKAERKASSTRIKKSWRWFLRRSEIRAQNGLNEGGAGRLGIRERVRE